jgi:predicted ATPase
MVGHRLMATSLFHTGELAEGRAHFDSAIALYDATEHRPLATRFGQDVGVVILSWRALVLWLLGYPAAALADVDAALENARETGQASTLMYALVVTSLTDLLCGNYQAAGLRSTQAIGLADEKGALFWKAFGMMVQGCVFGATDKSADAVGTITAGVTAFRSTGATLLTPYLLSNLARACAALGQFDEARRCTGEAITAVETTKEKWYEADVHRIAGEITLMSPERDTARAEAFFERALAVAREQKAKSWELRAATSMARLWRDQGKRHEARKLLAPVYGWFTEGFDTLDLKQAKALLDEFAQ